MPVGYSPNPSTMHPLWSGSKRNDPFDALQPLPAVGSYHPEIPASNLFGRYGLPYGGVPFAGDLVIPGTGGKTGHEFPGINGPFLLQGDLNGETGTMATSAAREELIRRFPGKGEPSPEEIADLIVAEWPPDLSKRPAWARAGSSGSATGSGSSSDAGQVQALRQQIETLTAQVAKLQADLAEAQDDANNAAKASVALAKIVGNIKETVSGIRIAAKGGGVPMATLRKIRDLVFTVDA